jgi:hypothetical protein
MFPSVTEDNGTWGEIVGPEYLMSPPTNTWIGGENSQRIHFAAAADEVFQSNYGWVYNQETGDIWAGSFDAEDIAIPRE